MRRTLMVAIGTATLVAGTAPAALAAWSPHQAPQAKTKKKTVAKPRKHVFTSIQTGNRLSTSGTRFEDTYRVKSSPFGEGSVIRDSGLSGSSFPATGTDTAKTYDRGGRTFAKESFTLNTPNIDGFGTITGKGTCTTGTGTHLGETCTYTFHGTYDLITGVTNLALSGTYTLGSKATPTH